MRRRADYDDIVNAMRFGKQLVLVKKGVDIARVEIHGIELEDGSYKSWNVRVKSRQIGSSMQWVHWHEDMGSSDHDFYLP